MVTRYPLEDDWVLPPLDPESVEATLVRAIKELGPMAAKGIVDDAWATAEGRSFIPVGLGASPLPYVMAGEVEPITDGKWLIDGVLPKEGVAVWYGHPGTAKTFGALDMASAVATGTAWNGRHVERGLVVYLAAEGEAGIRNRLVAMRNAGKIVRGDPFVLIPAVVDLQSPDGDISKLVSTVRHAEAALNMGPALVVIDTLSKTFGAGKENTDDMAGYVANLSRAVAELRCCILPIHHRPKDIETRDLRGHSSLRAGVDTVILAEGDEVRTLTITKQKDGEEGMRWRFVLDAVSVGTNQRGDDVTTCLVRYLSDQSKDELAEITRATKDNDLFLVCLRERIRQRRAVSEKRGPTFAPTEFAKMPESKKIGKERLDAAMDRLFRTGAIKRTELWINEHRKRVYGLREVAANGADNTARQTRQTVESGADLGAANAPDTHTYTYGIDGAALQGQQPPSETGLEPLPGDWDS